MFSTLIVLLFAASSVSAHGVLRDGFTDDVKFYNGDNTYGPVGNPIHAIRRVKMQEPNDTPIPCGPNAEKAPKVVDVTAGSNMSLFWTGLDNKGWRHNTGPIIHYLASCGAKPCKDLEHTDEDLKFFKIGQLGKKEIKDGKVTWYQDEIFIEDGGPRYTTVTIPQNIRPGGYLLRHEIIALHNAPMPEFYPGCVQLNIKGGNDNGFPTGDPMEAKYLVGFPHAYDNDQDSFSLKNAYDGSTLDYPFPGPDIPPTLKGGPGSGSPKPSSMKNPNKSSTSMEPPSTSTPNADYPPMTSPSEEPPSTSTPNTDYPPMTSPSMEPSSTSTPNADYPPMTSPSEEPPSTSPNADYPPTSLYSPSEEPPTSTPNADYPPMTSLSSPSEMPTPGNVNADNPSPTSLSSPSNTKVCTKKGPPASGSSSLPAMPTSSSDYPRRRFNRGHIMRRGRVMH